MRREVTADHGAHSCSVCARSLLMGESAERYLSREGERYWVCALCVSQAAARGWMRAPVEQSSDDGERRHAGSPRRVGSGASAWRYARAPDGHIEANRESPISPQTPTDHDRAPIEADPGSFEAMPVARDPYAADVSSSEAARITQAVGVFNESAHRGIIVGIARTLGPPWASAACVSGHPGQVAIAVVWELSWYEFRVDIDGRVVALVRRGDKLWELDDSLRDWNLVSDTEGRLSADW